MMAASKSWDDDYCIVIDSSLSERAGREHTIFDGIDTHIHSQMLCNLQSSLCLRIKEGMVL